MDIFFAFFIGLICGMALMAMWAEPDKKAIERAWRDGFNSALGDRR